MPLIGASGAIAGVVAAYLILHPRVKIWILAFGRIPLRIPAYITLVLWILFQFVMFAVGGEDQISWACHIGGIIAGAVLVLLLRRRDVPLFDREIVTPRAVVVEQPSAVKPVETSRRHAGAGSNSTDLNRSPILTPAIGPTRVRRLPSWPPPRCRSVFGAACRLSQHAARGAC